MKLTIQTREYQIDYPHQSEREKRNELQYRARLGVIGKIEEFEAQEFNRIYTSLLTSLSERGMNSFFAPYAAYV